jgi:hypothetical protein
VFFERWMSRLPLPLTEHDRAAGYWWELSMRQVEVSRMLVFDAPRHARGFFEAVLKAHPGVGNQVGIPGRVGGRTARGGHRHVPVAVDDPHHRVLADLARLRAHRRQDHHRPTLPALRP